MKTPVPEPPRSDAVSGLLGASRRGLDTAVGQPDPGVRYAMAHLAALRAAAAVLARRARPATRHRRPTSVWALLPTVAPELTEWAAFFSAGARKRAAAEAGLPRAVNGREADDLVRDAEIFLSTVELLLDRGAQPALPIPAGSAHRIGA